MQSTGQTSMQESSLMQLPAITYVMTLDRLHTRQTYPHFKGFTAETAPRLRRLPTPPRLSAHGCERGLDLGDDRLRVLLVKVVAALERFLPAVRRERQPEPLVLGV